MILYGLLPKILDTCLDFVHFRPDLLGGNPYFGIA